MGGGELDYSSEKALYKDLIYENNTCANGKGGDILSKLTESSLY